MINLDVIFKRVVYTLLGYIRPVVRDKYYLLLELLILVISAKGGIQER